MFTEVTRSSSEISETIHRAYDYINQGSKFPGMSYEEGIISMWEWLTGNQKEGPMDELK
ncbi:hypothetical protein MYX64_06455 [Nitrospinae bacterium AH_259_B05_G02_I21]|nr:hypothetical protein [Nitrospinae bacterium AH_259_B05_G02_I21]